MAKIKVTAGPGRVAPIDPDIATEPGGGVLLLRPGRELEVEETDYRITRDLATGDLVKIKASAAPAPDGKKE